MPDGDVLGPQRLAAERQITQPAAGDGLMKSGTPSSRRSADGVWLNTVTPCSAIHAPSAAGALRTASGTTCRQPPCSSAPQISQTEKPKEAE